MKNKIPKYMTLLCVNQIAPGLEKWLIMERWKSDAEGDVHHESEPTGFDEGK